MAKKGNKKKIRLKTGKLIKFLLVIFLIAVIISLLLHLKIKNIYIEGNTLTKDIEIIEAAGIQDYPEIYKLNIKKTKKSINELPLIEETKIKRDIFGRITIKVTESKVLFYYKYNNKYITSSGKAIDDNNKLYGYPTLINFTPDTIFNNLVTGLNKIDFDIINMISEIEYVPYETKDGTTIDDNRFKLIMNDTNTVMIDIVNIKNLNKYPTILASLGMDKTKGIIYLDTINDERIYFKSYNTINKEAEEAKKAAEEAAKKKEKEQE